MTGCWRGRGALVCLALASTLMSGGAGTLGGPGTRAGEEYERIRTLGASGRHAEAEKAAREALDRAVRAGAGPEERAALLDLRLDLIKSAGRGGQVPQARALGEETVRLKEELYGAEHPEVARTLQLLGGIYRQSGDALAALSAYERVLRIRGKTLPADDPEIAQALINVAVVESDADHWERAMELYARALVIQERSLPPDHPDKALTLNNVGDVLASMGDYEGALARFHQARRIREAVASGHPDVAQSLHDIGSVLHRLGDFSQARQHFERALAIRERERPPNSIWLSEVLGSLAGLHAEMGDFATARPLYDRAIALRIKAIGAEHMFTAMLRRAYGAFLERAGELGASRNQIEAALRTAKSQPRPSDQLAAIIESDLAGVLRASGDAPAAQELYRRSVETLDRTGHPLVAGALHGLANLLRDAGDTRAASPLYDRVLQTRAESLGADHPLWARALLDRARLRRMDGHPEASLEDALRAEEVQREHLRDTARTLPERQALRYEIIRASGIGLALSVILQEGPAVRRDLVRRVWDQLVRSRALVLDEMAGRHGTALDRQGRDIPALLRGLEEARRRRAWLRLSGPEPKNPGAYAVQMEHASRRVEEAERELAQKSAAFRDEKSQRDRGLAEVLAAMPPEAALVAYVEYRAADRARPSAPGVPHYAAFVARPGEPGPRVEPLGPAAPIDALVRRWRREVSTAPTGRQMIERTRRAGEEVRRVLWDPVAARIDGARVIFVVPDGLIHLVPLSALPASDGRFLVERGAIIHYLSSERDLIARGGRRRVGRGLLAVGSPDFDSLRRDSVAGPSPSKLGADVPYRGSTSSCGSMRSMRFATLPGAAAEVEEVERLWQGTGPASRWGDGIVMSLTGDAAQEGAFKLAAKGRRVIHLATHGFYGGPECSGAGSRGGEGAEAAADGERGSPLLLSGLALAGANRRSEVRDPLREEDGVLTAEEIASLDLRGVEWVVLSGCETGLGEVQAGEGVLGLRRAFEVAGAGTLILTLWPVSDHDARAWVRGLYRARLSGSGTAEALREASLAMIADRREAGMPAHPFSWGAFVGTGDWR